MASTDEPSGSEHAHDAGVLARLFPPGHTLDPAQIMPGELLVAQVQAHLAHYNNRMDEATQKPSVPSLAAAAADKVVSTLRYDYANGLEVLRKSCPPPLFKSILENPALPYSAFRGLGLLYDKDATDVGRKARESVDDWILKSERKVRRAKQIDQEMALLVSLDEADAVWPGSVVEYNGTFTARVITRKDPPREMYAILDERRARRIRVQPDARSFAKTWDRLTGDALDGLDWDNVFVAGGMALSTLMCVDPAMDSKFKNSDIDLYIYGLSPAQATKKIEEIYEVWWRNLGPAKKTFVVRNAKTFTFISNYPERRIQIILKMVTSPAAVLMNFDLDQCAIGWNGKEVLMLPRAARALETGYTIFTSDLIYGHHLGERRATQETRVFKYADKGFGILFTNSLLNSLEIDITQRRSNKLTFGESDHSDKLLKPYILKGKKAMRCVAWLGEDMTRRLYIGKTKMSVVARRQWGINGNPRPEDPPRSDDGEEDDDEDMSDRPWDLDYLTDGTHPERWRQPELAPWDEDATTPAQGAFPGGRFVVASFADMNGRSQHPGEPNGRTGLKTFETFMRMVELWRLEYQGHTKIKRDSFESTTYGPDGYDDLPRYEWGPGFVHEQFGQQIDDFNNNIFKATKGMVLNETIFDGRARWTNYFTRRFRRMLWANSLADTLSKQITIPIYVPPELESFIEVTMSDVRDTHGLPITDETRVLIAAHRPAQQQQRAYTVPSIPNPAGAAWALRIWVIGNTTMWAQLDRRIDEIFEVLWTLYHAEYACDLSDHFPPQPGHNYEEQTRLLGGLLERRPVPPPPPPPPPSSSSSSTPHKQQQQQAPSEEGDAMREVEGLKTWLLHQARYNNRDYNFEGGGRAPGYVELSGNVVCRGPWLPKAEEWWWNEEIDGVDDSGVWREVTVGEQGGQGEQVRQGGQGGQGEQGAVHEGIKRKREDTGSSQLERMVDE